ncbi:MAG: hypothetical protein GX964_04145 [Syntrophomonadaceae bacterium]|nr:hypothetical protein [Syntrophomonadaceae bacterium]
MLMKLKIKYCGGCNPVTDRKKVVNDVLAILRQHTSVEVTAEQPDILLVMGGCSVCCVDVSQEIAEGKKAVKVGGYLVDYCQTRPAQLAEVVAGKLLDKGEEAG